MRSIVWSLVLGASLLAVPASAEQRGGGGDSGLPSDVNSPRTIPQQFSDKLKIDRTQTATVDQLLTAAAGQAAPQAQEMLSIRQQLLNGLRANQPEQVKTAEAAYAAAATKIALVEADVLQKVLALAKPNQQKAGAEAFALIAGLFSNAQAPAARGGRGGPGGGRGGAFPFSRFESLVENFGLEGDAKKAVKTTMDDAGKSATPVRAALLKTHADLGAAVQGGKSADEVAAAAKAYGDQAAAMARLEMDAVAKVLAIADPKLENGQAIQAIFFMARGMFLKSKWDEIPPRNVPSY